MIWSGRVQFHDALEPLLQPIDTVTPHPANYNNGDVEAIGKSIAFNGMYRPVTVQDSTGYIIAGNHTWVACKEGGADVIPVVRVDVDDTGAKRMMVDDNHIAKMAMPDNALLVNILEDIAATSDLDQSSYNATDLEVLNHLVEMAASYDEFAQWPTLSFQLPPHMVKGFRHLTREADTDRDRFELLMRLAGWTGK